MLRLYVRHIEAFFGQERREISCKAILDSERALVPLRWFKLDVGIDEDPGCFREGQKSKDCCAWTACNAKVHLTAHSLILQPQRRAMAAFIAASKKGFSLSSSSLISLTCGVVNAIVHAAALPQIVGLARLREISQ
jgi:hypothetical protein